MAKKPLVPDVACEEKKNELLVKDFKRDLGRAREIRNLANRLYKQNGECVFQNDYTLMRFWQSVVWYIKKAKSLKFWFFFYSTLAIVLPVATTLLNTTLTNTELVPPDFQPYCGLIISILSALTAVISALLSLFKFQHRWIQCRFTAESLQKELSLFLAGANDYSDDNFTTDGVKQSEQPPAAPDTDEQEEQRDAAGTTQEGTHTASQEPTAGSQQSAAEQGEPAKTMKKSRLAKIKEDYFLFKMEQIMANEQTQWYNLHKPSKDK